MLKKVLVFGMTDNPGGMESCIMNYYRHVDKNKIHFDFLCNWESMVCEKEVKANGSKVYTIPQKSRNYKAYKRAMNTFFSEHADEYDVFWYNTCTLTNIDYLIYAKRYGIKKRIIHAHNTQLMQTGKRRYFYSLMHHYWKNHISRYATDFWACSESAGDFFYKAPILKGKALKIIHNAIETEKYAYDSVTRKQIRETYNLENRYVIGHVGRFQFQKNHEFLIDIFYEYLKLDSRAVLMLVGQGEEEDAIRQKVMNLGIEKSVLFMGVRTDVNRLLQAMDVFLLPSRFEGLPLVLIEAQTAGLKCFASKDVITEAADLTGNVEFISLKEDADIWAGKIYSQSEQFLNRTQYVKPIIEAGYDIRTEADKFKAYLRGDV